MVHFLVTQYKITDFQQINEWDLVYQNIGLYISAMIGLSKMSLNMIINKIIQQCHMALTL